MDISNFAVSPNVYKLTFVLAAFAPQDLSQNTAHKAVQKAFHSRTNFESLPIYAVSKSYVASGEDLSLVIAYLAANSSGKTQSVARDMLDRFGVDFTVEEGRIVMAARTQEEDEDEEEDEFEEAITTHHQGLGITTSTDTLTLNGVVIDKSRLTSLSYKVDVTKEMAVAKGLREVPFIVGDDGMIKFKLNTLGFVIGDYASEKSFKDLLLSPEIQAIISSLDFNKVFDLVMQQNGKPSRYLTIKDFETHFLLGERQICYGQLANLFKSYVTMQGQVLQSGSHLAETIANKNRSIEAESSTIAQGVTQSYRDGLETAPPPTQDIEMQQEERQLRLARIRAERFALESQCKAIEAESSTIVEKVQSKAREEIAKSMKVVTDFQDHLNEAESTKRLDARFISMVRSLTLVSSPTNYEASSLVKDFNDLRGVLTGHGPSFAGPKTIVFGKICAFELAERTGSKPDKKLTTLAATNQTNQVNAYDKSEWDWIRVYWKAFNALGSPTFLEWKDIVVDIRQENGELNWPSDFEQFMKGDGDLRKFCASNGKQKPTLLTKWFRQ